MKLSIFTDASVVQNHCGYAFYIGCTAGKLQKAGKLRHRTTNTVIAELYCLANALYTLKHSKFAPISKVWIWCDQKNVIEVVAGETRTFRNPEHRKVVDEIKFLMMEICMREQRSIRDIDKMFCLNHIKAHTGNQDILSRINSWCDQEARRYAKPIQPNAKKKKR